MHRSWPILRGNMLKVKLKLTPKLLAEGAALHYIVSNGNSTLTTRMLVGVPAGYAGSLCNHAIRVQSIEREHAPAPGI